MFGFFNIAKPSGPTSHDIVDQVRQLLGRGVKVGHAGTLDPFADGVLAVCVGPATRLADYVQSRPKRYAARVSLGAVSATDDPEGPITPTPGAAPPLRQAVEEALAAMVGEIQQSPPAHSAVHVNGNRAYKLARKGRELDIPPRPVVVHEIRLARYEWPVLEIDVRCGGGTYIRALARDIGKSLGVGGYCAALTRTEVGPFHLDQAKKVEALDVQNDLIGPLAALEGLLQVTLTDEDARRIGLGQSVMLRQPAPSGQAAVLGASGELIAIANLEDDGLTLRPDKVFPARPDLERQ